MKRHLNEWIVAALLSGVLSFFGSACGANESSWGSIRIVPQDVQVDGCLSLEKLIDQMDRFPRTTQAIHYSKEIIATPVTSTRPEFTSLVILGAFRAGEGGWSDIVKHRLPLPFSAARQSNCSHVTLYNEIGSSFPFEIRVASETELSLAAEGQPISLRVAVSGEMSVQLDVSYIAKDPCRSEDRTVQVSSLEELQWNAVAFDGQKPVNVKAAMLQSVASLVAEVPASTLPYMDADSAGFASIPFSALKELRDAQIQPEILRCDFAPLRRGTMPRFSESPAFFGPSTLARPLLHW